MLFGLWFVCAVYLLRNAFDPSNSQAAMAVQHLNSLSRWRDDPPRALLLSVLALIWLGDDALPEDALWRGLSPLLGLSPAEIVGSTGTAAGGKRTAASAVSHALLGSVENTVNSVFVKQMYVVRRKANAGQSGLAPIAQAGGGGGGDADVALSQSQSQSAAAAAVAAAQEGAPSKYVYSWGGRAWAETSRVAVYSWICEAIGKEPEKPTLNELARL
jgi:hypothetical protein